MGVAKSGLEAKASPMKPEELEEAIGVVAGNSDPAALNRLQELIDAEYSQWVSILSFYRQDIVSVTG